MTLINQDDFRLIKRCGRKLLYWLLNTEIKAQNFLRRITMQYGIVNGHSTYFHEFFFYCIVWKRSVQLNIFSFQRQYLEEKHKGALSQLQSNSIHCWPFSSYYIPTFKMLFSKGHLSSMCFMRVRTIYLNS